MIYARIDGGLVVEIIQPLYDEAGYEYPIVVRFTPEFVATLIDISDNSPAPNIGWAYQSGNFSPPEE